MGKFRLEINKAAKKDFNKIYKSGDKTTIRKLEQIILELEIHPEKGIYW